MNETQFIFTMLAAFGLGWLTAYFFKNMGALSQRWGIIIAVLTFPLIIILLLATAEAIAHMKNVIISAAFALVLS